LREKRIPARFSFACSQPRPSAQDNKCQKCQTTPSRKNSSQIPKLFPKPADSLKRILREGIALSNIGITTNLMTKVTGLPSAANEFVIDLNQLAHDLQSGNIAAAEEDYVLFSEAVLNSGESVPTPTSNIEVAITPASSPGSAAATGGVPTPVASSPGSESLVPSLNLLA
jgi:hypothetical protein